MRLFELDPNNPIDRELSRTAKHAANDGSLDDADMDPMGGPGGDLLDEPMGGPDNAPDPAMGGEMDPRAQVAQQDADKPVDGDIMAAVQGHEYVQNYEHSDTTSDTHPVSVIQMDMEELMSIRNQARGMDARNAMSSRVGLFADPEVKAARDFLSFVDHVIALKKNRAKDDQTSTGQNPKVRERGQSKVKFGDRRKAKTS